MLKQMFNRLDRLTSHGHRFEDINGDGWGVSPLIAPFESRESHVTVTAIGMACAYQAVTAPSLLTSLVIGSVAYFMAERLADRLFRRNGSFNDIAIDREGRSQKPENNDALMAKLQDAHNILGKINMFGMAPFFLLLFGDNVLQCADSIANGTPLPVTFNSLAFAGPMALGSIARQVRFKRILSGRYSFCATPPDRQKNDLPAEAQAASAPKLSF